MRIAEINNKFGVGRTNKKDFLNGPEAIIPWKEFIEIIQPGIF